MWVRTWSTSSLACDASPPPVSAKPERQLCWLKPLPTCQLKRQSVAALLGGGLAAGVSRLSDEAIFPTHASKRCLPC